jgi:hypothetical protein
MLTAQKRQLPKVIVFVLGLIAVVAVTLTIIWILPCTMCGYGERWGGFEAVAFLFFVGSLIVLMGSSGLLAYGAYRGRRRGGAYGDYRIRRTTIWQYWLPMMSVLSLCGIVTCLIVALLGPGVLSLIVPRETYWKIEHERKLIVEFALRQKQAPWATTAFQDAVQRGDLPTIRRYVRYGADSSAQDVFGRTALHASVMTGNEPLVRMFLDMGVEIGARDHEDQTALHCACRQWNSEILRLLIDAGADINATSQYGTALDIAKDFQNRKAVDILRRAGAREEETHEAQTLSTKDDGKIAR